MKWIVAMVAVLAVPALAFGGASMTLTEHGTSATAISVAKGGSVVIDLQVDFDDTLGCGGFNLALREAAGTIFDITARNMPLGNFMPVDSDGTILPVDVDTTTIYNLGGIHDIKYGAWAWTGSDQVFLELTLSVPANAPLGMYTINLGAANPVLPFLISVKDHTGLADQTPLTTAGIDIFVGLPEPASMLLLAGALPFLRRRRSA